MSEIAKIFARNFRVVREALGLTQSEIATQLGVDNTTISGWENAKFLPDKDSLDKIPAVMGKTVGQLYSAKMETREITLNEAIATMNRANLGVQFSLPRTKPKSPK